MSPPRCVCVCRHEDGRPPSRRSTFCTFVWLGTERERERRTQTPISEETDRSPGSPVREPETARLSAPKRSHVAPAAWRPRPPSREGRWETFELQSPQKAHESLRGLCVTNFGDAPITALLGDGIPILLTRILQDLGKLTLKIHCNWVACAGWRGVFPPSYQGIQRASLLGVQFPAIHFNPLSIDHRHNIRAPIAVQPLVLWPLPAPGEIRKMWVQQKYAHLYQK